MATAVSAAEMAMENRAKKYPSSPPGKRNADKYGQCVAAGEEPVDTGEKHDSRNYQIIFHVYHNQFFFIVYVQSPVRLRYMPAAGY